MIRTGDHVLSTGSREVPALPYYENQWLDVIFRVPAELPAPRVDAKLELRLEDPAGRDDLRQRI